MSRAAATTTRADFFAALFPDPDVGFIELRALPGGVQGFFTPRDFEGIEQFLRTHSEKNLFYGVASRRSAGGGALANCGALSGLFVDIDSKTTSEAEARARLERFPLKPSIKVASGGGLHVYWLLREPLDLSTEADRARSLLRRLALTLGGDLASAEPARVLRIPGTLNYKYQPPRRALTEHFDADVRYNLCDLPEEPEAGANGAGHFTVQEQIHRGERNAVFYRLARSLKAKGLSASAIRGALVAENKEKCDPPLDEREVRRIAEHAYEQADRAEYQQDGHRDARGEAPDALAGLRVLGEEPSPAQVEAALRAMLTMLNRADPLQRERLRAEAVAILKAKKVTGAARFVDVALGMTKSAAETADNVILLADPEPWPDPVDGAALLAQIEQTIRRFVVLPLESAAAAALWVLFAHAHEAFDLSPILAITSATMRCGKTLLLQIVSALVPKALTTSNISPAALFRTIEAYGPTLLIDECDSFIEISEDLRGLLNSGHTRRGAVVIRTVGEEFTPCTFRTWCPKVVALIGKLPGTLADRSLGIQLQRKTKSEQVDRFRSARLADLAPLCQQATRWVADNLETLKGADPETPLELNDRAADNWRPLLAIADAVGGEWPGLARKAALALAGEGTDESFPGVTLIGDMMLIFKKRQIDELATSDLIAELVKQEEHPWSEWRRGKPITPRGVAGLLKPFRIASKVIRFPDGTQHGYERKALEDAYIRYFGGFYPKHPKHYNEINNLDPLFYPKQDPHVSDKKGDLTMRKHSDVSDVSDRNPKIQQENITDVIEGVL